MCKPTQDTQLLNELRDHVVALMNHLAKQGYRVQESFRFGSPVPSYSMYRVKTRCCNDEES